ncbi:recombinase family protein [Lachnospiraceae bacterium 54-11]
MKKQLEKDGDLTAMGKSLWHYATISHILKNRLYCGELEYRKEYVPDYLEQKRAKNKGVHSDDLWRRKMRNICLAA